MSIFSDTLIFLRERQNITREALAETLCVSTAHIKRLETDYIEPDDDILNKLAQYFDVTTSYLLGGTSRFVTVSEPGFRNLPGNFLSVPVLSTRHAMKRVISESEILERVVVHVPGYKKSEYIGILIDDEKLVCERMRKGDIALVEITNQLLPDDLVAVNYNNEVVFFRRYSRLGPTVILTSERVYDPITFNIGDPEYTILGKVIGFHAKI